MNNTNKPDKPIDPDNPKDRVWQKLQEIANRSNGDDYLYRGEPECYPIVSSSLYRACVEVADSKIEIVSFDFDIVQRDMLKEAKKFTHKTDEFEILSELQHYGGKTNVIDFTTDYHVALFFACDSSPDEDGRVILLCKASLSGHMYQPQKPVNRVIGQKSVFVNQPKGFVEPDIEINIPKVLKQPILDHLQRYHSISKETIYNDLQGFIRQQDIHKSAYTMFYLGLNSLHHGKFQIAIKLLSKSIDLTPNFPEAYILRGQAFLKNGCVDEAFEDCNKAIELDPKIAGAYINRGIIYARCKDFNQAIKDFTKAIDLDSTDKVTYYNRGKCYAAKGKLYEAKIDFTLAIDLDENFADAYMNRSIIWLRTEKWRDAESDLTIAKNIGMDIAIFFVENHTSIEAFEKKYEVTLPEDIAAILRSQHSEP